MLCGELYKYYTVRHMFGSTTQKYIVCIIVCFNCVLGEHFWRVNKKMGRMSASV